MPTRKQPTMQQIADAVGVSRMAVSLALRNSPKISEETTRRIREAAEALGYRPNPLVSALMTQLREQRDLVHVSTIAYITAYATADGWRRPGPFIQFFDGARARAEQLGYRLEHAWLRDPGVAPGRFCEILQVRGIHGIIIAPLAAGSEPIECDWSNFAAATIGYSLTAPDFHRASNHQYGTIATALRELARLGYRRVGFAMPAEIDERVRHHWSAGMLVYQQGIPAADRVPLLLSCGSFARPLAAWISAHRPEVIVSQGGQVPRVLEGLGLHVPADIGFVDLALEEGGRACAGMDQNSERVGAAALDLVDAQLRHNERGIPAVPQTVLIPGRWVEGGSVRAVS